MEKIEKIPLVEKGSTKKVTRNTCKDDLDFMEWKAELNKELISFWREMKEQYLK